MVRPEAEHLPLNHARLFGVDQLSLDLLTAKSGALVLQDLLLEVVSQIGNVGIRRGAGDHHIVALPAYQLHDQILRPRGRGADQPDLLTQTQAELHHVPRLLQVIPCGQLVTPATVELRASESLGLGRRDALNQAPVDQHQLV